MVTVIGTEFTSDATLAVGGVSATKVVVQGSTSITAVIGAHPGAGTGDVLVSAAGKSASLLNGFTFFAPTGANHPPVVTSIRSVGSRANQPSGFGNIDDSVTLVPSIVNAEGASVTLTYEWSGSGSFTASSDGTTTWRLPTSVNPAPSTVTATLVVSESFAEGAVTHLQSSAPASFALQLHDSQKEILDMGEDFLTLFTRQLPSSEVLHNFSTTCDGGKGRSEEANDGATNRANYIEDINAFRISRRAPFSINFRSFCPAGDKPAQPNTDACSSFAVQWEGIDKTMGNSRFVTKGIDYVSAVLESNQWKLCHSTFVGTDSYPALGITRAVSW